MARDFNGTTDRIDYANAFDHNSEHSMAGFVRCDDLNQTNSAWIFGVHAESDTSFGSILFLNSSTAGQLQLTVNGTKTIYKRTLGSVITEGQEHHLAVTFPAQAISGDQIKIYVDGALVTDIESYDEGPWLSGLASSSTFIGGRKYDDLRNLDGAVRDVCMWDAVLTAEEIAILAKGYSPEFIRPSNRVFYAPLINDANDVHGRAATLDGTTVIPHGRIIRPSRQIYTALEAAGGGTTLTINDLSQSQSIDNLELLQSNVLTINSLSQAQYNDGVVLVQHNVLTVFDIFQDCTISSVSLTEHGVLSVSESGQSQSLQSISLSASGQVEVQPSSQNQSSDNLNLTQHNALNVAESNQAQTLEGVVVSPAGQISVQETAQGQIIDNIDLTQHSALSLAEIDQAQQIDSVGITTGGQLNTDHLKQSQYIDVATLIADGVLVVASVDQVQAIDNTVLTQSGILVVDDMIQFQTIQNTGLGLTRGWLYGELVIIQALDGALAIRPAYSKAN